MGDPRSSIGFQNVINNVCFLFFLFCFNSKLNRSIEFYLGFVLNRMFLMRSCIFSSLLFFIFIYLCIYTHIPESGKVGFYLFLFINPPLLVPLVSKRPLILYLTVTETTMRCVFGKQDEIGRKERAIYYLSKKFMECESRYTMIEKLCCTLAWAAKRLRKYMLYHTTWLISKLDPLKYIYEKPYLFNQINLTGKV